MFFTANHNRKIKLLLDNVMNNNNCKQKKKWIKYLLANYRFFNKNSFERNIIEEAMKINLELANLSNNDTRRDQHNTCVYLYMCENKLSRRIVADMQYINIRAVYKHIDRVVDNLAVIIFGIDGMDFSDIGGDSQ